MDKPPSEFRRCDSVGAGAAGLPNFRKTERLLAVLQKNATAGAVVESKTRPPERSSKAA